MPEYSVQLRAQLGPYKTYRVGVKEDGIARSGYKHGYILPETYQRLNILETYRREFWTFFDDPDARKDVLSLQSGFHHLDSTQAMCFNLFAPFVHDSHTRQLLLEALGRDDAAVNTLRFDRIIDRADMLCVDFFVELKSDACLLFELKLAETQFDAVLKPTPGQTRRLRDMYIPLLQGKVPDIYLQEHTFFHYDHLLRNIALLELERADHLYIIFPRQNEALCRQENDIQAVCAMYLRDHVTILHLEDLLEGIQSRSADQSNQFRAHFDMFKEKYLLS
jgi:hypothetical protein